MMKGEIMKKEIVIATNNEHKVKEFKKIFEGSNFHVLSLKDAGIICDPIEDGLTFKENALIKAREVKKHCDKIIISDDSGLMIEGLNNFPGIYSSRFISAATDAEKCQIILKIMETIPNKKACFVSVIALIDENGVEHTFEGIAKGNIIDHIEGINGFGYDPIFYSTEANEVFAKLNEEEKNRFSHRGKALTKVINFLKENN